MTRRITSSVSATTVATIAAGTIVAVLMGGANKWYEIRDFRITKVAGSCTTIVPRICGDSSAVAESHEQFYRHDPTSAHAVTDQYNPSKNGNPFAVWAKADANGYVYVVFAPDAGADNQFKYTISFECIG